MEGRRRSGVREQTHETGFYRQSTAVPAAPSGPYRYYQPPAGPRDSKSAVTESVRSAPGKAPKPHVEDTLQLPIDPDAVPANVRDAPWGPEPEQEPQLREMEDRPIANTVERLKHGSVSDQSPLQKLERELVSKEEKRARAEEAEAKVMEKDARKMKDETQHDYFTLPAPVHETRASDETRHISEPVVQPEDDAIRADEKRLTGPDRFRRASEALKSSGSNKQRFYAANKVEQSRDSPVDPLQGTVGRSHAPIAEVATQQHRRSGSVEQQDQNFAQIFSPLDTDGATESVPLDSNYIRSQKRNVSSASADITGHHGPRQVSSTSAKTSATERPRTRQASSTSANTTSDRYHTREVSSGSANIKTPSEFESAAARGKAAHERRKLMSQQSGNSVPRAGVAARKPVPNRAVSLGHRPGSGIASAGGNRDQYSSREVGMASAGQTPYLSPSSAMPAPGVMPAQPLPARRASPQAVQGAVPRPSDPRAPHHLQEPSHHHGLGQHPYPNLGPYLEEWRSAGVARLTVADLTAADVPPGMTAQSSAMINEPYEEDAKNFSPPLYLRCGPLLRYTGMRREKMVSGRAREVWRGSIMIVTDDRQSDVSLAPTLRLFVQSMELHIPPSPHLVNLGHELPPEAEDPVTGQVKLSRTGRPLYVRPVHDIDAVDLSRAENPQGLYAATRTPVMGPQSMATHDVRTSQHITFQDKTRIKGRSGESVGCYREIRAARLHTERGLTFWRFNVEIELATEQKRIAYRINNGPAIGFWVPALGETMNVMFHSCNGFSLSVDPDEFCGPDPLWRDVLNKHQARPFHLMIGGGDQIYNDAVMHSGGLFTDWINLKNPEHKRHVAWTPEMQDELEQFYLDRYAMWFSQGLFAMANSQIPMVNMWDDHDIIDGFGSYPHHFMRSPVFSGLGAVAFKYYMLFQHQSLVTETEKEEPSWLLGANPGPYINELSRSVAVSLGKNVFFLALDCRMERMRDEVLTQGTYDKVFDRVRYEIGERDGNGPKHLIILLGVPIAYPRLNFLENTLTSRAMDPIKSLSRMGVWSGFTNKFDGGVEVLDDLDDHWTAKHHKAERNWLIQELQALAAETSVRITILGGDVHLATVGRFYTPTKFGVPKGRDPRYMANIISSAIANTPPPNAMADLLNRRNKVHHLDDATDEDMISIFWEDVDGKRRNNNCLLPRRNYCTIREYFPDQTPQAPVDETFSGESAENVNEAYRRETLQRRPSLTRGLVRRLTGSRAKNPPLSLANRPQNALQRSNSLDSSVGQVGEPGPSRTNSFTFRRSNSFTFRRPTDAVPAQVQSTDLVGGLDISLNVEVDQHDPAGNTVPYRLVVPTLLYEGEADVNAAAITGRRPSFMDRFRGRIGEPVVSPSATVGGPQYQPYNLDQGSSIGHTGVDQHQGLVPVSGGNMARSMGQGWHGVSASNTGGVAGEMRAGSNQVQPQWNHQMTSAPQAQRSGYRRISAPQPQSQPQSWPSQGQHQSQTLPARGQYPSDDSLTASFEEDVGMEEIVQDPGQHGYGHQGQNMAMDMLQDQGMTTSMHQGHGMPMQAQGGMPSRPPRQRRPSKVEQFFGIGDVNGPWGGNGQGRVAPVTREDVPMDMQQMTEKRRGWSWRR